MKFERVHKWVLYALLVIGFLPLSASGEVPAPVVVLFHGGIVASWFVAVP